MDLQLKKTQLFDCFQFILIKVKTLWEGRKIWKKNPEFWRLFIKSADLWKQGGDFFQIFVAFSKKLNFKRIPTHWAIFYYIVLVHTAKFSCIVRPSSKVSKQDG